MNLRLFNITVKSFMRRYKQVFNTCLVVFMVMLFVTLTAIFRDNMYNMQDALNKDHFGSWFVMETTAGEPNKDLSNHKFLEGPVSAGIVLEFCDSSGAYNLGYLGYMDEDFYDANNVKLREGKFPEKENEIAIEYSALVEGNYSAKVGDTIRFAYYKDVPMNDGNKVYKDFVLSGIIDDYTEEWYKGKDMPRAVISKAEYDKFDNRLKTNIYTYGLKSGIELDNNYDFYLTLEAYGVKLKYNQYVYDYKLWGAEFVYNYMYIAVMLVGATVLIYKMLDYCNMRISYYQRIAKLGASKKQVFAIKNFENLVMVVVFGIFGIGASVLLGNIIATIVEKNIDVKFYKIGRDVYIRSAIGLIVALIAGVLANIIFSLKEKRRKKSNKKRVYYSEDANKMERHRIGIKHKILTMQQRISKSEGLIGRLSIRLFLLCITFIIIGSIINIKIAKETLDDEVKSYDMAGYFIPTYDYEPRIPFVYEYASDEKEPNVFDGAAFEELWRYRFSHRVYDVNFNDMSLGSLNWYYSDDKRVIGEDTFYIGGNTKYVRNGSDNIINGFSDNFMARLNDTTGIKSIDLSTVETQRTWNWIGMDYDMLDIEKLVLASSGKLSINSKYFFATEYFNPTKELYERISEYIEPEYRDYEAFCRGEHIVIFLNKNVNDVYDTTINVGTTINYQYYDLYYDTKEGSAMTSQYPYVQDREFLDQLYVRFSGEIYIDKIKELVSEKFGDGPFSLEELSEVYAYRTEISKELRKESAMYRNINFYDTAAKAKVVGVVYIDENNKSDFSDIVSQNAYYNAVASSGLADKLLEKQNELIKSMFKDEYKDEYKLEKEYNYYRIKFDSNAVLTATDNLIKSYSLGEGLIVENYFEQNNMYRERYYTTLMQNGVTIMLAIMINLVVATLLAENRFNNRKEKFITLYKVGMSKKQLRQICMLEVLREDLWCIITLPLAIIIQYVLYSVKLKRL